MVYQNMGSSFLAVILWTTNNVIILQNTEIIKESHKMPLKIREKNNFSKGT